MEQCAPTISVILPVYNTGNILQETIDSVLYQTYHNFELIIINDGSSDSITLDILKKQQDKRIKVINQPNKGVAAARNRGLQEASGQYIAFLDHDDIFLPDKLAILLKALQKSPNTVLVYTQILPFGEKAQQAHIMPAVEKINYLTLLHNNNIYSMSCVMLNVKLLENVHIRFDDQCVPCDDWDFYLHCSLCGEIKQISPPLVKYRLHDNNQSTNRVKMYQAGIRVLNKHRSFLKYISNMLAISQWQLKRSLIAALTEHHYGLAYYYFRQKKYYEAIKIFTKAFIKNPLSLKLPRFILKKLNIISSNN